MEKHRLKFEILSDFSNEFAAKLDLVHGFSPELKEIYLQFGADLKKFNGEPSWTLAIPARIVVGRDHRILYIQFNADYTKRPEPEEVFSFLS